MKPKPPARSIDCRAQARAHRTEGTLDEWPKPLRVNIKSLCVASMDLFRPFAESVLEFTRLILLPSILICC
jgi:hypothetical protein